MSTFSYIPGAQVLAYSISAWLQPDTELVMLVIYDRGMNWLGIESLHSAKWAVHIVNRIPPPKFISSSSRLRDLYTKFTAWNMTEYSQILLVDADIIILRSFNNLLKRGFEFAALIPNPSKNFSIWSYFLRIPILLLVNSCLSYAFLKTIYL